jgi:hypothetical protein
MKTVEKATINFTGVLPNEDDFTGHWVLTTRSIVIPFSEKVSDSEDKETKVLQALREGTFEVEIFDEDNGAYIGDVLEKDQIISAAKKAATYQEFYDDITDSLHEVGYDAYVEEYGREMDYDDEDEDDNEFLDENGVNGEAFEELMYEGDSTERSKIDFEVVG